MEKTPRKTGRVTSYPSWAPRFWHGMLLGDWLRLLVRNRFRIHPLRIGLACTVTGLTAFNSVMSRLEKLCYRDAAKRTELIGPPIFVLGHWRSGTTFLHELLSADDRFATPTTFQCFAANHFLITEAWMPKLLWFIMPKQRPMDNVKLGWDEPQEDEFALCSMGAKSPYLRIAFPNQGDDYSTWLDMHNLSEGELKAWRATFDLFLRRVTKQTGKRLILKSPTHTGRIQLLQQMYPDARFIHITRDPLSVIPSTIKLWDSLDDAQGLQFRNHDLRSFILATFQRMYRHFEEGRESLTTDKLVDIRYEDLVTDPIAQLHKIYDELQIGEFAEVQPKFEQAVSARKGYKTNQYVTSKEERVEIREKLADFCDRYGYDPMVVDD